MEQIILYIALFGIIVIVGQVFHKSSIPISLLLLVVGMLLSLIPNLPKVTLNSGIVLDIFLPLLIYQISSFSSWQDVKKNLRPIALLSVGHVIFIACLVAVVMHTLLPELGWGLAFVLGAVISPPDDVAIVSIAEKIRMPAQIVTILEGEGMFNDVTALILFRFALAAVVTNQFLAFHAISDFFIILTGETLYGLALGYLLGELRTKIRSTPLHMIASIITPFIAYFPAVMLGGCGVLATVVTGFIIGNRYSIRFTPEFRLVSRAVWPSLAFALQHILFLLVGLNLYSIVNNISSVSMGTLALYATTIIAIMIIGRFVWVYGVLIFLPRFLFSSIRKKDPYPPWQYPFVISWAGMRGGISLAAALAIPLLPYRDLIIFLVFCAIAATLLLQGLSLPWLLKKIGVHEDGKREEHNEHMAELTAKFVMNKAVLQWLASYRKDIKEDKKLLEETKLQIREHQMLDTRLKEKISGHDIQLEPKKDGLLLMQIIEIEKSQLLQLWRDQKINLDIRNKLLEQLDHRAKNN